MTTPLRHIAKLALRLTASKLVRLLAATPKRWARNGDRPIAFDANERLQDFE